jgi:hypothetical protein
MQGTDLESAALNASSEQVSSIRLLIAYEDFSTGKKAQRAAENLARIKQLPFSCPTVMWKFDLLRVTSMRTLATEDALQAGVILLSVHGDSPLPNEVRAWIAEWLPRQRTHPAALALLLDCPPDQTPVSRAICSWLRKTARRGKFDFFFCAWSRPRTCSGLSPTTLQVKGKLAIAHRLFRRKAPLL